MKTIKKFFILGIFSTLIDYLVYSALIYINVNYIIAICAGYFIGFLFNFYFGRKHVFETIKINNIYKEFFVVFIITIIGVMLNIIIVYALKNFLGLNYYLGRIVAIGVVFFFNYYSRKGLVYG